MRKIIDEVIEAYGGVSSAQARFGYSDPRAVYNWRARGIPHRLLPQIHMDTRLPLERLLGATKGLSPQASTDAPAPEV
jgi:hypothetical protein